MLVTNQVLEGYLCRAFTKDAWRLRSWTQQDYVQEGLMVYLTLERKYTTVTEPPHMMALFKSSWWRWVHDRARGEVYVPLVGDEHETLPYEPLDFDVDFDSAGLSSDARQLLRLLTTPGEILDTACDGIVLKQHQALAFAQRLTWNVSRVRFAFLELLGEYAMPTPIQTLVTATGVKQADKEDRQAFLIRLVQKTADLPEDSWTALPREAQDWYNKSAEQMNSGQPLEDMADAPPAKPAKPVSEAKAAQLAARNSKPSTPPEDAAAKAESQPGAKVTAKQPNAAISPTQRARELMSLDAAITPSAVRDVLQAEGYALPSMSSLQAMRSDIRAVLKILEVHGKLVSVSAADAAA
jgi:hypothetical protein